MIAAPGVPRRPPRPPPDHRSGALPRRRQGAPTAAVASSPSPRRSGGPDVWFLSMLFVHPDEQARGLGRALSTRSCPAADDAATLATCTDAAQPVSNALYARLRDRAPRAGPRAGRPAGPRRASRRCPAASGPCRSRCSAAGPVGRARRPRHLARGPGDARPGAARLRPSGGPRLPRRGAAASGTSTTSATGRRVGYGYTSPAGASGRSPSRTRRSCPGVLGHLMGAVEPAGAFATWVPGAAGRAVTALLEAGLRLEDFPALLCWDRPFADFSRYVPITLAVL